MRAVRLLEKMGYRNLGHYSGGVVGWRKEQLPLDAGETRSVRPEQRSAEGMGHTPAGP